MSNKKKYYIFNMDMKVLNIGCTLLLIILMIISLLIYSSCIIEVIDKYSFLMFFGLYFIYMIIHELLHSIAYVIYGGDFKNIVYGICLEKGVLCCLCKQNVNKNNILHSLMYPLVFIGIVTYVIALIFKFPLLFILSIFNIAGCIGDIIMFFFIRKLDDDIEFSEYDDPLGFGIYSDKDISKVAHFGLKYIECCDNLVRDDLKMVTITWPSIVIILLFVIIGIIFKYMFI